MKHNQNSQNANAGKTCHHMLRHKLKNKQSADKTHKTTCTSLTVTVQEKVEKMFHGAASVQKIVLTNTQPRKQETARSL